MAVRQFDVFFIYNILTKTVIVICHDKMFLFNTLLTAAICRILPTTIHKKNIVTIST